MTTQDLELQDAILLSIHWTEDIEEAREKELSVGCLCEIDDWDNIFLYRMCRWDEWDKGRINTIIGKPPTLSRTLSILNQASVNDWGRWREYFRMYGYIAKSNWWDFITDIKRQLLDDQGNDMNLRDQSQETKDAIYSLICK
jgi:hypothetical protein